MPENVLMFVPGFSIDSETGVRIHWSGSDGKMPMEWWNRLEWWNGMVELTGIMDWTRIVEWKGGRCLFSVQIGRCL